jgi:cytochrome c-type biogenesis protein
VLTFLAPCTLPLVPGFLGFISGTKASRARIFWNAVLYVIGFSIVFISLGVLVGLVSGVVLVAYQDWLNIIGGAFVVVFGIFMLQGAFGWKLPILGKLAGEYKLPVLKHIKPGTPLSSVIFGAAFATGWTPCVGPVLGAILTLTATTGGVIAGALLLSVFSLGLAVPFLILAAGFGYFSEKMGVIAKWLPYISGVGGLMIIVLGVLVMTDNLGVWIGYFFRLLAPLNYEAVLLKYL